MIRIVAILAVGLGISASAVAQDATPLQAVATNAAVPAENLTMPTWSEFPVPPTDVPSVAEIAARVADQAAVGKALKTEVAALHWDSGTPQSWSTEFKARLDPAMMKPVDKPMSQQSIEALGAELRRLAVPPPVAY